MRLNSGLLSLEEAYVFAEVRQRTQRFSAGRPEVKLISLGIGDVPGPLCPAVTRAMRRAVKEQGRQKSFHGYGPEQGYPFLRQQIAASLTATGAPVQPREVFINDGAKTDLGGLLDLLEPGSRVLLCDPTYPAVWDDCLIRGLEPVRLPADEGNDFLPMPPPGKPGLDAVYLCSPANPTGAVYNRAQLSAWVEYARANELLILFDAAYAPFISDPALPRSIYEIPGAHRCAIEIGSFSKLAGFTGTRCGYAILPCELIVRGYPLQALWARRQSARTNGVSYVVQCGAAAVYSPEGRRQTAKSIARISENAALLAETLKAAGLSYWGGRHSPYLWVKCPRGLSSWAFFDFLLEYGGVVGTPGVGFGAAGEGYFRFSAFGDPAQLQIGCNRLLRAMDYLR